jgi:flagellar assembly factor FliW
MIRIEETRFGTVEVETARIIRFPNGLVGFPEESEFVLLERSEGKLVAYLQSVRTPSLAFPIVDSALFADYPNPSAETLARDCGLPDTDLAVLVIVAVSTHKTLEANLLAPIVVDLTSHTAVQAVLDARKFSAAAPLVFAATPNPTPDPLAAAQQRIAEIRARAASTDGGARQPSR